MAMIGDGRFVDAKTMMLPQAHNFVSSSWSGVALRRTASLPLAYVPAIHVFTSAQGRRGCPGQKARA
jgi:hypothetical protein